MKFKRIISITSSVLMLASLGGLSATAAEAPKRPQPLTVVPPPPAYMYMPKTEKNASAFDETKMLTQTVLISPENKKTLLVINVEDGVIRNKPLDQQIKKKQAEMEKALAENKKNNPFWELSDSVVRFPTLKGKDGVYNIAAHASNARDLVIYTMPNGGKWNVKKGQTLNIKLNLDLSMYKVGKIPAQKIEIGYIKGKELVPLVTSDASAIEINIKIPVTGAVEFYTMNATLDREILANGSIKIA